MWTETEWSLGPQVGIQTLAMTCYNQLSMANKILWIPGKFELDGENKSSTHLIWRWTVITSRKAREAVVDYVEAQEIENNFIQRIGKFFPPYLYYIN